MIEGKKIAIDARMIEMSGIGTYIQHLLGQGIYDIAVGEERQIRKVDQEVEVVPFEAAIYGPREQLLFPEKELKRRGAALTHFPHYDVPLTFRSRFVVTVHDLIHVVCPESMESRWKPVYAKVLMGHALRNSQLVFTDSQNSRQDIQKVFHLPEEKIRVVPCANDAGFHQKRPEEVQYLRAKYGIGDRQKVILYVGNLKLHKNLGGLMASFRDLLEREMPGDNRSEQPVLILAGKAFSSLYVEDLKKTHGLGQELIITGAVLPDELVDLYNLADVLAFPSLYEGFGLPPLEAMASGTPVVCSNTSSLPEVCGDAALMVDPTDHAAFSEALYRMLTEEDLREEYIRRGLLRAQVFHWEDTVRMVREGIRQVI